MTRSRSLGSTRPQAQGITVSPAASGFFLAFAIAYYVSYPARVFCADSELEIFRPILAVCFIVFVVRHLGEVWSGRGVIRVASRDALVIALMVLVVASYGVNAMIFDYDELIVHAFYKNAAFALVVAVFLLFRGRLRMRGDDGGLCALVTTLVAMTCIAVILNSVFQRLPLTLPFLDEKYFVGPLVRAGGGYLDPNFLSLNIVSLLFVTLMALPNRRLLRWANVALLLACVFLTFSRGAYLFVAVSLFLLALKGSRGERRAVLALALIVAMAVMILLHVYGADFLFRRFSDEEGASSTNDRLFQYSSAFEYLAANFGPGNLFIGFGGLTTFQERYGMHLHNYLLALLLDIGVLPALCLLGVYLYFVCTAETLYGRLYLALAGLQLMSLPDSPDPLYLGFVIALLRVERPAGFLKAADHVSLADDLDAKVRVANASTSRTGGLSSHPPPSSR